MRVRFREGDATVAVRVDGPVMADVVATLFPHHRVEGGPGAATEPDHGWDFRVVAPAEGEAVGGFRLAERGASGPTGVDPVSEGTVHETLPDLLVALELGILRRLLRPLRGCVHLHAAGAVVDGRAVLALGPSGAGKSSLALAWWGQGLPLLGDDLIPMGSDGHVRAFPRLAKIDRSRLAAHGLGEEDTVAPVPEEPETWVDLHGPAGAPSGWHPVGLVARVELDPSLRKPTVEPLAPPAILAHLVENLLDTGVEDETVLDVLIPVAEAARGVHLRFGESARAARTLLHLAGSDRT